MMKLQYDSRSIWNRARKQAQPLTVKDLGRIARMTTIVAEEIYDYVDGEIDSLRNEMPEDSVGLANDVSFLEKRVSSLEEM